MIAAISPWRSLLFVPAHVQRFVESAHRRGADAVLLDLEDSVPAGQKAAARTALGAAVERLRAHGASVLVRVNRPLGECVADLSAAVAAGADAVVLPKTLGPDHVRLVDEHMAEREAAGGLRVGGIGLVAMIETVDALASVRDIAAACPRLTGLAMGGEDLAAEIGVSPTPELLFHPCQQLALAARSAGVAAYGFPGSIADVADREGFGAGVRQGRAMGFDGAFCIHPAQVAIVNAVYRPAAAEIEQARRIVDAYDTAVGEERGAVIVDGCMVDLPVVERARTLLSRVAG